MIDMRAFLLMALLCAATSAAAQIYRWVDANGVVHYSNTTPPKGANATVVDGNTKEPVPSTESTECYTIRCQGERMEERQRKRDETDARIAAERAASAPKQARGLDFRNYVRIQRGMTEGELLGIAGEPDLKSDQGAAIGAPVMVQGSRNLVTSARSGLRLMTYTYMPTPGDPYTTTITLVGGRVSEIERIRKF
jgi:hypothetical protein